MKISVTTILLVCSLGALVVAGLLSAADGQDQAMEATVKNDGKRPWKCCDRPLCTRSLPPQCRCLDTVVKCASACKQCDPASSDPSRFVCNQQYRGFAGPNCTTTTGGHAPGGLH